MLRRICILAVFIVLILFSHFRESATSVKPASDTEFSAENAFTYLQEIAKQPHPIGSIENQRVRDYLLQTMSDLGLKTELMTGHTYTSWKPSYNKAAYIENVVATLHGSDPNSKKVIIAGHYDSVMEGPGAADDGYSVACMIETARLLKSQNLKNDIIFLITDGEEYGLLGAQYYVEQHDMQDIGLVLNYEARGASGPGIAFEWSDNNAWLVDEMQKCYKRPIANSLSYEIYKRMPNASDFTEFMIRKVPGINHAFIDGFSYYHHPQDDLHHVSKESIQHTGENMYLAAQHFGNFDFASIAPTAHQEDATFFNFYGFLFAISSLTSLIWLILSSFLLIIGVYVVRKEKKTNIGKSVLATLSVLLSIIVLGALGFGLSSLIKASYPQYETFYSYHWYNHEWYFFSGIGLVILILGIIAKRMLSYFGNASLGTGLMITLLALSLAIFFMAPSGTYIMMFPLAALAAGIIVQSQVSEKDSITHMAIGLVALAVFIGFWTFFSHTLYLAFSLGALPGAIIPTALFCLASMVLLPSLWRNDKGLMPILGGILFLATLMIAHFLSKPTPEKPLKSSLFYVHETASGKSHVATSDAFINEGHFGQFTQDDKGRLARHIRYSAYKKETQLDLTPMISTIDTVGNENILQLTHPEHATMVHIYIEEIANIDSLVINGLTNKDFKDGATGYYYSPMYGIGLDSMTIRVVKRDEKKDLSLFVNMQYNKIPIEDPLPAHIVRNGGLTYISHKLDF